MYSKHERLLKEFRLCIDEKRYYDAHEAIEEIWFPRRFEKNDEVLLLKGFINAAVCFELIKLQREKPSKTAWLTYLKYRPLLYKVKSPYLNDYHQLSRLLERLKNEKKV
ncbi:MAG: DUF309 domain-containing protein [Campylobacterota bacterium]|nr:DUF309 domain-containing protein [Campylobacterota bacterium]